MKLQIYKAARWHISSMQILRKEEYNRWLTDLILSARGDTNLWSSVAPGLTKQEDVQAVLEIVTHEYILSDLADVDLITVEQTLMYGSKLQRLVGKAHKIDFDFCGEYITLQSVIDQNDVSEVIRRIARKVEG